MKLKPEVSKKNRYWISKHRYYELKHYCLQYKEWKSIYLSLSEPYHTSTVSMVGNDVEWNDSTSDIVLRRNYYLNNMKIVEGISENVDLVLGKYIFKGVTDNVGYTYLKNVMDIPCGKDMYYAKYRKFFWMLDKYFQNRYYDFPGCV